MADESVSAIRPVTAPAASLLALPVGLVRYLGVFGLLGASAMRSVRPSMAFARETGRHFEGLLAMGLPLVAVVHVGMGSFLAMQAYFGATFLDGIGPVVGVGLVRNLAPLLAALTLAGLLATRYVADLRGHRDIEGYDPGREAASRILAAGLVGPILGVWGAGVGIGVGFLVGHKLMGVSVPQFFDLFAEMLWTRDVIGLVGKGFVFAAVPAWIACHEGLHDDGFVATSACRVACLAGLTILVLNGGSFLLFYHAGPAFGPTVLTPPTG